MYRYYISFAYQDAQGFGMAGVDFNFQRRIAAKEELSCVHEQLARQGYHNITILGFSLYAQKPDPRPRAGGNRR
jgi:hypothetical protein